MPHIRHGWPLAHGVPGRVGLLRGYGNAINPWVAAEFIQAVMEIQGIAPSEVSPIPQPQEKK